MCGIGLKLGSVTARFSSSSSLLRSMPSMKCYELSARGTGAGNVQQEILGRYTPLPTGDGESLKYFKPASEPEHGPMVMWHLSLEDAEAIRATPRLFPHGFFETWRNGKVMGDSWVVSAEMTEDAGPPYLHAAAGNVLAVHPSASVARTGGSVARSMRKVLAPTDGWQHEETLLKGGAGSSDLYPLLVIWEDVNDPLASASSSSNACSAGIVVVSRMVVVVVVVIAVVAIVVVVLVVVVAVVVVILAVAV